MYSITYYKWYRSVCHVTTQHSIPYTHLSLMEITNEWQGRWTRNAKAIKVLIWKVATP